MNWHIPLDCTTSVAAYFTAVNILLSPFNLDFRLHSKIGQEPWAKLWYSLRALDKPACGYYEIPLELIETLINRDEKSIYRLLKDGQKFGAFRRYKIRGGILYVWLGGLYAVCQKLNLKNWGAVAVVNLLNLSKIRSLTTATATQALQQGSHYAAKSSLKKEYRKFYAPPHPNELFPNDPQSSPQSETGQVPRVLHISESRVFVSKNFTAFGTSQHSVSCYLGIHTRTVRRHQLTAGMISRQLCQSKSEYAQLDRALQEEASEAFAFSDGVKNPNLGFQTLENGSIQFLDGVQPGAKKSSKPNQWIAPAGTLQGRFFTIGHKYKKWFLAKCNIYREDLTLTTMRASRKAFRARLQQLDASGTVTVQKNRAGAFPDDLKIVSGPAGI